MNSTMSFEIEQKYRTRDHLAIEGRLNARTAVRGECVEHEDLYLSHPARDFAESGEAFRIRRVGTQNAITYKGPRFEGPTKTRRELEVPFEAGTESLSKLKAVFEALGFRPVATVRKVRMPYHLELDGRPFEVALDVAEGLGSFVEVETIVESEADFPDARQAVIKLAGELGLNELEPRSYLRMLLERETGAPPAPLR
jgi:adenylate cyclase, class 2